MRFRFPWKVVSRSRLEGERARRREARAIVEDRIEELEDRAYRHRELSDAAIKGVAAAEARRDEAYRACGKLISDIRMVSFSVNERVHPDDQSLRVMFEIRSEMFFHTFRSDKVFREVLAYMLEDTIRRDPKLYRSVLSWPGHR